MFRHAFSQTMALRFRGGYLERLVPAYLFAVGIAYCLLYYFSPVRPRAGAQYPLGWYGWADQGEYLKSAVAFAFGDLSGTEHLYPPLYNFLAAPFVYILPTHPHFVPDLAFLLIYVFALTTISRQIYGPLLAPAVLTVLMISAPLLSITQWVIPWTTSLQAALVSGLLLCYSAFERRGSPFVLSGRRDYILFCAFFLAYGALLPTRPLDLIALFPFALCFFARVTIATAAAFPRDRRAKAFGACVLAAGSSGLIFVVFYFAFNVAVFKSPFGSYVASISQFRYDFTTIFEKAYSIFSNSAALYGEGGQAFFERVPLLGPAFALCIVTAIVHNDVRRWIIICAFLQITMYLPYGDLLPTGVFRYYNLHYFKWLYPWIFVIAAGQAIVWIRSYRSKDGWKPLAVAVAITVIVANIWIVPTHTERVTDAKSVADNTVSITLKQPRDVNFIDIQGLRGGFTDFYFGNHAAVLDGTITINRRDMRLLPIANGARMLFSRTAHFSTLLLKPDPAVKVDPSGLSTVESFRFAFACRFHDCKDAATPP
jgi:hypothetical protein